MTAEQFQNAFPMIQFIVYMIPIGVLIWKASELSSRVKTLEDKSEKSEKSDEKIEQEHKLENEKLDKKIDAIIEHLNKIDMKLASLETKQSMENT